MALALARRGDVFTVVVTGDLDVSTLEVADPTLLDGLGIGDPALIDLTNLSFIDSTGLGFLITVVSNASSVRLLNAPRQAKRLLQMTGTDQLFTHEPAPA